MEPVSLYELRTWKVSAKELGRYWSGPFLFMLLVLRLFRVPWPRMRFEFPLSNREMGENELPTEVREAANLSVVALESAGFQRKHVYSGKPPAGTLHGLLMLSSDGTIAANVQIATIPSGLRKVAVHLGSENVQGTRFLTSSTRPMLVEPPEYDSIHFPDANAEALLKHHRARTSGSLVDLTKENLFERQRSAATRWHEFQVERGVLTLVH